MISNPKKGQRVQIWYAASKRSVMRLHGKTGIVEIVSEGRPRNHGVWVDGQVEVVPAGNLREAVDMEFKSQFGQDRWVCETLGSKRAGYFADVGAYDGETFSNTWYLEKALGWTGVCVEPLPSAFALLERARCCRCLQLAVAPVLGPLHFKPREMYSAPAAASPETIIVATARLEDVLAECRAPAVIDYLSLDIEGGELAALRDFPFERYKFRLATIEHNDYLGEEWVGRRTEMHRLLSRNGYRFAKKVDCDDWWLGPE